MEKLKLPAYAMERMASMEEWGRQKANNVTRWPYHIDCFGKHFVESSHA
jgi:hypothetical protein